MIYKFKLVSNEVSNFVREIEIDSDSTFFQLRNAVLESVGYSKDDLDSFFLCDDDWERQEEITQEDMGISSSDKDIWVMDETPVGELVEDEGQKLVFVYNYITDQAFYMELKEMIPGRHLKDAVCTFKKGTPPPRGWISMNLSARSTSPRRRRPTTWCLKTSTAIPSLTRMSWSRASRASTTTVSDVALHPHT